MYAQIKFPKGCIRVVFLNINSKHFQLMTDLTTNKSPRIRFSGLLRSTRPFSPTQIIPLKSSSCLLSLQLLALDCVFATRHFQLLVDVHSRVGYCSESLPLLVVLYKRSQPQHHTQEREQSKHARKRTARNGNKTI